MTTAIAVSGDTKRSTSRRHSAAAWSGSRASSSATSFPKNLEWQSRLAQELLEPAEIGLGIAAELRAQHAGMAAALEAGAHLPPTLPIGTLPPSRTSMCAGARPRS
jgi:hypothetical protein